MMNDVVAVSADLGRRIMALESEGYAARARDIKIEWSMWRDTLSPSEKERCVWAFVAAQMFISRAAMEILKEEKPDIYEIYIEARRGSSDG